MGDPFVYMLSPEEGAGFSPEAAGEEGRPVKLKWLFASISVKRNRRMKPHLFIEFIPHLPCQCRSDAGQILAQRYKSSFISLQSTIGQQLQKY